ncbi:hypothetical protein ACHAXS_007818 [Conticribra weissflogii]
MKIFGKRKSSGGTVKSKGTESDTSTVTGNNSVKSSESTKNKSDADNEDVPSYFAHASDSGGLGDSAAKKKKPRASNSVGAYNGDDIEILLEMDPSKLNSKQRRLVRRHREREGAKDPCTVVASDEATSIGKDDVEVCAKEKPKSINYDNDGDDSGKKRVDSIKSNTPNKQNEKRTSNETQPSQGDKINATEILAKLEGLNSKDRRKFLRQLRRDNPEDSTDLSEKGLIAAAEDEARRIAEKNRLNVSKENSDADASKKRKAEDAEETDQGTTSETTTTTTPKKRSRRRKSNVNADDLSPEERQRREQQRKMQKEAAERRAAGLVDPNRHPLNSERRRANRRKPGRGALIAMKKKEEMAERGRFNAVGYQMRRGGAGSSGK